MLWRKAWLETRARFLISLGFVVAIEVFFVRHAEGILPREPKTNIYELMYFANFYLAGLCMLGGMLLGMGGLLREKAMGISTFTLALPVSRARLAWTRIGVGAVEAIALGVVPWAAILLATYSNEKPFFISQAGCYVLVLVCGGLVYFAIAILASSLIEGEYAALALTYGSAVLIGVVCGSVNKLRPFLDLWRFMTAENLYNRSTHLLTGALPWAGIVASLGVAATLFLISVRIVQARDY